MVSTCNNINTDEIKEAIQYLDWYFYDDDGMADKNAVKFYELLKKEIKMSIPDKS